MSSGYGRTCQCSYGYEEIDGQCVKGKQYNIYTVTIDNTQQKKHVKIYYSII